MPRIPARASSLTQTYVDNLQPEPERYEVSDSGPSAQRGLIVRVFPNGRKAFYLRYHKTAGGSARLKLGDVKPGFTVKMARDMAAAKLTERALEDDPVAKRKAERREARELGKFIENEFNAGVLKLRKSGTADLARMKKCFAEFWNRKLNDQTMKIAITNWRKKRLEDGTKPATLNKDIAVLKRVYSWAVENDYLSKNPILTLKPFKLDKAPKVRYLSPEEEKALMEALDAREAKKKAERDHANELRAKFSHKPLPSLQGHHYVDHVQVMILLSLHTGVRRGELFTLDWQDINFTERMLTVRGENAKSGQTRRIPLNSVVLEAVRLWHEQTGGEELVFRGKGGKRFDNANSAWEALLKDAKISSFRWHDMRHSFASKLVIAGVDLNTVRELLGHVDLLTTLRYAHLAPHVKAAAVEALVSANADNITAFPAKGNDASA